MGKRVFTLLLVVGVIIALFKFCNNKPDKNQPAQQPEEKSAALNVGENSTVFNQSFNELLASYYALKDAFVASDAAKADAAAAGLVKASGALKTDEIKGDSTGMIKETALQFTQNISATATALAAEKEIEGKRKQFETITDALWSLTRTVQYDGQKVYYQYCPMAFDNKGAYWLSNNRQIRNPYFGDKMLKCGEIADSLDYSKR